MKPEYNPTAVRIPDVTHKFLYLIYRITIILIFNFKFIFNNTNTNSNSKINK